MSFTGTPQGAPQDFGLPAGGGGGGGGDWFADAIWIDGGTAIAPVDQDGTMGKPFSTIQAAVDAAVVKQDALPVGNGPGDRGHTRQIFIVAGGIYDETVRCVRGDTWYAFLAAGPVTLGDGAGVDFQSTTPRDFVWVNDQSVENADTGGPSPRRPTLVLGTFPDIGSMSSTHTAIASGWTISGDFVLSNPGGAAQGTTAELHLNHVKVVGDLTRDNGVEPADFGIRNCHLIRCFFDQIFNIEVQGGNGGGNLVLVEDTEFDGLITVDSYSRICNSEIAGGLTTVTGFNDFLPPGGMFNVDFSGTYTGPVVTCLLDYASNFFFKTNGAALAGGATKRLIGDTVA